MQNSLDEDQPLRVIVRYPHRLPKSVRERVDVIEASHGKAAVVGQAFEGAEAVLQVAPPDITKTQEKDYFEFTRPAAEVLRRLGATRVVSVIEMRRSRFVNPATLPFGS